MLLHVLRTPPEVLLQEAQRKHEIGDFTQAAKLYRKAYKSISEEKVLYPAEVFTRLPLILQQAGSPKEAWREFHNLLTQGCPGRNDKTPASVRWLDRAVICDKARLFLQRQGEFDRALLYGVQFYFSRCMACYHDHELGQFGPMTSTKALQGLLRPLLQRANKLSLEETLVGEMKKALRTAPDVNPQSFSARIAMLITLHNLQHSGKKTC